MLLYVQTPIPTDYQSYPNPPTPFWPLQCYYYLYFTHHSHETENNIVLRSPAFVRLRITSIWLRLRSPAFLDLIPCTSTSTHCVLPRYTALFWLFFVLARILSVSLRSRLIFCYLHRTTYMNPLTHLHTLIQSILSRITPHFTYLHRTLAIGTDLPGLRTFRSFSFQ